MTIDSIGYATTGRPMERQIAGADAAPMAAKRSPATSVDTANAVKGSPSLDEVNRAVSELNQSPQAKSQGLEFSIDSDSKRTVVKVIDQSTKEVLRQIPTPEALEIAKAMEKTSTKGVLIQQIA
ncbi:flagellar biosynthesis protein FlaG [Duganella sp. Leaf126]|uniref:flagellar protein FlaG n=1 Tax=Duganella sp. Leaf126 TaxID=1736266 RepID=UPI0006FA5142|nr:flagellar protein FlaG [Duganella sp. Leaf126]KQQ33415.1 flagellar biosynthesis protein FlaG [Duganella sp. Leaf126]